MASRANRQLNRGGDAGARVRSGRVRVQQAPASFQKRFSLAIGKESEVADADETLGQYVLEESPQELGCGYGHLLLLVPMRDLLGHVRSAKSLHVQKP